MNILKLLVVILLVLQHTYVWGAEELKREVTIGISFSIPPYVIQDSETGLEFEILKESFAASGYRMSPSFLSLARTFANFEKGLLDAVINVKEGMLEGFYSDIVITFRNYAVTLQERELVIESFEDLHSKSIVAFQRASKLLGNDFGQAIKQYKNYSEIADQSLQVKRLFKSRVEVIILEERIFNYYRSQLYRQSLQHGPKAIVQAKDLEKAVVFHDLFEPSHYRLAFASEKIRNDFNKGLKAIRNNGVYASILAKYNDDLNLIEEGPAPRTD